MNDRITTSSCERADDLISFLYGESSEQQARDFERHLATCGDCGREFASFRQIRNSIGDWKHEALSGFPVRIVETEFKKKSAVAALKNFFDLSPLWLKGAVGFATLLFCAMILVLATNSEKQVVTSPNENMYSRQQVDQIVGEALQKQSATIAATAHNDSTPIIPTQNPQKPRPSKRTNTPTEWARQHKPLSKAERDQLATDLRLLSNRDQDSLNLIGDKINQEF